MKNIGWISVRSLVYLLFLTIIQALLSGCDDSSSTSEIQKDINFFKAIPGKEIRVIDNVNGLVRICATGFSDWDNYKIDSERFENESLLLADDISGLTTLAKINDILIQRENVILIDWVTDKSICKNK